MPLPEISFKTSLLTWLDNTKLSHKEAADILDIPIKTLHSYLYQDNEPHKTCKKCLLEKINGKAGQ
jgi:DNA-directed RNA polymerase specialized sigma24 family protein